MELGVGGSSPLSHPNMTNIKTNIRQAVKQQELTIPKDFLKVLSAAPLADSAWKSLTPLARWDFIIWINSAKQLETRSRRIKRTCALLSAGKRRPCCFTIVPTDLYKALEANVKAKSQWKNLTAIERRNFIDWIDSDKELKSGKHRVERACALLASGNQRP